MTPESWRKIDELYHAALEREPGERGAFLDAACSDVEVRREVESLLEQSQSGVLKTQHGVIHRPAADLLGAGSLGPYRVIERIGAGGLGVVFKARDTRNGRIVVLKIGMAPFSSRFEGAAREVATLQHPHVCALLEVGAYYLVMEHVEGKPLHGPIAHREALRLAAQVAGALDAAHRRGIVHGDLKASNVLRTKSGIKVLDFGCAFASAAGEADKDRYQSPEQAEGRPVDARSDIFAFGLLFYEMLTGSPAAIDTAAGGETLRVPSASPAINRLLHRCLAADPEERWQSSRDLCSELEWLAIDPDPAQPRPERRSNPVLRRTAIIMVVVVVAAIAAFVFFRRPEPAAAPAKVTIAFPPGFRMPPDVSAPQMALSPDGRNLALALVDASGRSALWLRPFNSGDLERIDDTDGAELPFWSPDSQNLGFFAGGKLKVIPVNGGSAAPLADAFLPRGGTWNAAGDILFASGPPGAYWTFIQRTSNTGSDPEPLTRVAANSDEAGQGWPQFLPDGRRFLYWSWGPGPDQTGIYTGSLDSAERRFLVSTPNRAQFLPPDRLLYLRAGVLYLQHIDLQRSRLLGSPVAVNGEVSAAASGAAAFSVSSNAVLVYRAGLPAARLRWFAPGGKGLEAVSGPSAYAGFRLSPDGRRAVVEIVNPQARFIPGAGRESSLWLLDLSSLALTRLTYGEGVRHAGAVWSPDSSQIAFLDIAAGGPRRLEVLKLGQPSSRILYSTPDPLVLHDWSPGGRFLLAQKGGNGPLISIPAVLPGDPSPLAGMPYPTGQFRFSHDGNWVAYNSAETGRMEVFVAAFPFTGVKRRVSAEGGCNPVWRKDGNELFYLALSGDLVSVPFPTRADGDSFDARTLFHAAEPLSCSDDIYGVSANADRFLALEPAAGIGAGNLHVILNFDIGKR